MLNILFEFWAGHRFAGEINIIINIYIWEEKKGQFKSIDIQLTVALLKFFECILFTRFKSFMWHVYFLFLKTSKDISKQ